MQLVPMDDVDAATWDALIANYDTKLLFHESCWLRFLEQTQPGHVLRLRIEDHGKVFGYLPGLVVSKGPFRIFGSPLPGTTTSYMGPAANAGLDQQAFLVALDRFCRRNGIAGVELRHPLLDCESLGNAGFVSIDAPVWVMSLAPSADTLLAHLDKKTRYEVRKGVRDGMQVVISRDASFVAAYYAQLRAVFSKRGLVPSYPIERVQQLLECLGPERAFTIAAQLDGRTLATGIFVHDERHMYYFGGATHLGDYRYYPNEPIQWKAITIGCELGLQDYDLGGGAGSGARFKSKFGGHEVAISRYCRYYSPVARVSRDLYEKGFRRIQQMKGYWQKRRSLAALAEGQRDCD